MNKYVDGKRKMITFKRHGSHVSGIAWDKTNLYLMSIGYLEEFMNIWDLHTQQLHRTLTVTRIENPIYSIDLAQSHNLLALALKYGRVILRKPQRWSRVFSFRKKSEQLNLSIRFSPDERFVACCSGGGSVYIWESSLFGRWKPFEIFIGEFASRDLKYGKSDLPKGLFDVCFSSDGKFVIAGGQSGLLEVWDIESDNVFPDLTLGNPPAGHEGYFIYEIIPGPFIGDVLCSRPGRVEVWNITTGKMLKEFQYSDIYNPNSILYLDPPQSPSISLSPDNTLLAVSYLDEIVLRQTDNWYIRGTYKLSDTQITVLSFSRDGKYLAAGCHDGTIKVWKIQELIGGEDGNI